MTKYTTTSLIEVLKHFLDDLPIETELSLLWKYPEDLIINKNVSDEEFTLSTQKNATGLYIFEGSWEKDNISDVDSKLNDF